MECEQKLEFLMTLEEERGNYEPSVALMFEEAQAKTSFRAGAEYPQPLFAEVI